MRRPRLAHHVARPTALGGCLVAAVLGGGVGAAASAPLIGALCGVLLLGVAVHNRDPVVAVFAAVPPAVAVAVPWPVPALVAAALFFWWRRRGRDAPSTGTRGHRIPRRPAAVVTMLSALSCAGSAYLIAHLSLPPHLIVELDEPSAAVLVVGVVFVSLVNATGEELLWRYALASWLDRATGRAATVTLATASSFGLSHMSGIPSGVVGVVGATAFGLVLAVLRTRVGLVGCVAVHAAVDAALLCAVVPRAVWIPAATPPWF